MKYKLEKCKSSKDWDQLNEASDQGNIFCSSFFLNLWINKYELYFVKYNNDIIAGIVVSLSNEKIKEKPFIYQGILFNSKIFLERNYKFINKSVDILKFIIEKTTSLNKNFNLSLHTSLEDIRPFLWFNYKSSQDNQFKFDLRYTGILKLNLFKDYNHYFESIRTVRRQEFRKLKEKAKIYTTKDINLLNDLHKKTFTRQNINRSKVDDHLIMEVIPRLIEKNVGRMIICKDIKTNTPLSLSYFVYDNSFAYNLILATDPKARKLSPGTLLMLNQIEHCFKKKIKYVDFVGVNSPNRGDYKMSFNLKSKLYFNIKY